MSSADSLAALVVEDVVDLVMPSGDGIGD